jgi:hypothetical protein
MEAIFREMEDIQSKLSHGIISDEDRRLAARWEELLRMAEILCETIEIVVVQ